MAQARFSKEQQMLLSKNSNVTKVTEKSITYSCKFKVKAIKSYAQGKLPDEIFREAGLGVDIIANKNQGICIILCVSISEYYK